MSPLRDFLQRFTPAGTPGKAAAAAVPADRARDLAAELEPVFAMLAVPEAERVRILSEADGDARRIRDDARRRADDLVATARERAQAVRAEAAAAVLARAEAAADAEMRAAEQEAQAIQVGAARRMPGYVSRAVRAVLTLAGAESGDDAGSGDGADDATYARAGTGGAP
jgi:vacuolar-type H+-ATPase subunit H